MFVCSACKDSTSLFCASMQKQALLTGSSDVIVVKHKDKIFKSTPFLACFGTHGVLYKEENFQIIVNKIVIKGLKIKIDKFGYLHPYYFTSDELSQLNLHFGINQVVYKLLQVQLRSQIYLLSNNDKILVSDVDGTLTRNDIGGVFNNFIQSQYLHVGYSDLIKAVHQQGYHIIWLTMRSLPFYDMSKNYIQSYVKVQGAILMEPEQFLPAIKKQLLKKTDNIKANLMNTIKQLFTSDTDPFIGGLGNRENDAIAYLHAGIPLDSIYIINNSSEVQKMDDDTVGLTYSKILQNIEDYFPKYEAPKVGYK